MRTIVEDLESLKEINDELEDNHIETEKQMQAEIGMHCLAFHFNSVRRYQRSNHQRVQEENVIARRDQGKLRAHNHSVP